MRILYRNIFFYLSDYNFIILIKIIIIIISVRRLGCWTSSGSGGRALESAWCASNTKHWFTVSVFKSNQWRADFTSLLDAVNMISRRYSMYSRDMLNLDNPTVHIFVFKTIEFR